MFGIQEDDRCIDTGIFQERYLLQRVGVRLQPPPAAAATNQLYNPDSSRLGAKRVFSRLWGFWEQMRE